MYYFIENEDKVQILTFSLVYICPFWLFVFSLACDMSGFNPFSYISKKIE